MASESANGNNDDKNMHDSGSIIRGEAVPLDYSPSFDYDYGDFAPPSPKPVDRGIFSSLTGGDDPIPINTSPWLFPLPAYGARGVDDGHEHYVGGAPNHYGGTHNLHNHTEPNPHHYGFVGTAFQVPEERLAVPMPAASRDIVDPREVDRLRQPLLHSGEHTSPSTLFGWHSYDTEDADCRKRHWAAPSPSYEKMSNFTDSMLKSVDEPNAGIGFAPDQETSSMFQPGGDPHDDSKRPAKRQRQSPTQDLQVALTQKQPTRKNLQFCQIKERDIEINDVLLGRGGKTNHHPGNATYLHLIQQREVEYMLLGSRNEKTVYAMNFVQQLRDQGIRFLKKDKKNNKLWNDVGDDKMREKVSQNLRERQPLLRKKMEGQGDNPEQQQSMSMAETHQDTSSHPKQQPPPMPQLKEHPPAEEHQEQPEESDEQGWKNWESV